MKFNTNNEIDNIVHYIIHNKAHSKVFPDSFKIVANGINDIE